MQRFAELLTGLIHTPQRNTKLALISQYLRAVPDPDRGYALAALTGELEQRHAKPAVIRRMIEERYDPELFRLSYDFVGDLAETVSLIWPESPKTVSPKTGSPETGSPKTGSSNTETSGDAPPPLLGDVVRAVTQARRENIELLLADWLDRLDADGRWALLKFLTGGLRVGVSARLAKLALADAFDAAVDDIEEIWHGIDPPYTDLFAWLEGSAERPCLQDRAVFRPLMLANPIEQRDLDAIQLADYAAEWKWDGIRVQLAATGPDHARDVRLYARSGDDISASFPDIVGPVADNRLFSGVVDGELLVRHEDGIGGFNDLQQRLGRKTVSKAMLKRHPAFIRLYDILFDGEEDLRPLPFTERRGRLEALIGRIGSSIAGLLDLSEPIETGSLEALDRLRRSCRGDLKEGLMLKRKAGHYQVGRPRGEWFKWKRDPLNLDCVLMYAQRGHGKRSSYYSDYTFGAWIDDAGEDGVKARRLVPVGKAYSGFTDEELVALDRWIRNNTTNRFGPVREVQPGLVLEIGFDSVHRSQRHKSGVAMRFPRVLRIRWDKPFEEADRLSTLEALIE